MRWSQITVLSTVIFVLSLLGLADTLYLTIKSSTGGVVTCNVVDGCQTVLSSRWSRIFGVPTALFGLGYYSLLTILAGTYNWWRDQLLLQTLVVVSSAGLVFSMWLVYLQLVPIGSVCEYCLLSAVLTLIIFALSVRVIYIQGWYN